MKLAGDQLVLEDVRADVRAKLRATPFEAALAVHDHPWVVRPSGFTLL